MKPITQRTRILSLLAAALALGWTWFAPHVAVAEDSTIADAVDWLLDDQDPSGLWGVDGGTPLRDATVVVDVLSALAADSAAVNGALDTARALPANSTDYRARLLTSEVLAGRTAATARIARLAAMQSPDGGWGYRDGHESNALDTALALTALSRVSYADAAALSMGVNALALTQNPDGGWPFGAGGSSNTFITARAIFALVLFADDFDVATEIEAGVAWLRTNANPDGGFGSEGTSNPYETGFAVAAMTRGGPAVQEITNAVDYLWTRQLPDGSWSSDAYATAVAVLGLSHVAPDLALGTSDIVLSNPAPSDSEVVAIHATIHNRGLVAADDVLVRVYDGDPALGSVQIGDDVVFAVIPADGESTAVVDWSTLGLAGDHSIHVVSDPLNEILEPEESNNIGTRDVHVLFPADLLIGAGGIVFVPPEPDTLESLVIQTTVRNVGETPATNVSLQVWDGLPDEGGIPLLNPPYNIPVIGPQSAFTLNLNMGNYFNSPGRFPILACADVEELIREIDEENNWGHGDLWVGPVMRTVLVEAGLNLLGLPVQPSDSTTSFTMMPKIPNCVEIDGWDRAQQRWLSAAHTGEGAVAGDDFSLAARDGFFARVLNDYYVDFVGARFTDHIATDLSSGLDLVSVPNEDACYTAYSMIAEIDSCLRADSWDAELQAWETAERVGEDQFTGENFPVVPGRGYFVKVTAPSDWMSTSCDTFVSLPDLLVTPSDIYFDPYPATAGSPVVIAINISNIGDETAIAPRLDIYVGDPDQGGSPIMSGYVPDIPPGEASGYYGGEVTFDNSGSYEIYGIADHYDEIEEYDEENNSAHRTLPVNPAALAARAAVIAEVTGGSTPPARIAAANTGALVLIDRPIPGVVLSASGLNPRAATGRDEETRSLAEGERRTSGEPPAIGAKARVTVIEGVAAGSQTSASAAITWVSDEPADGHVNYGTTTALGSSTSEIGPERDVHMAVLGGLSPSTPYYYEVVSGGVTENNNGDYYTFTTTSVGTGIPYVLYGQVTEAGTGLPIFGVSVTGVLHHDGAGSHPLVRLTDSDGMWVLNLGNLKASASGDVLEYALGDTFLLTLEGGSAGSGADTVVVSGASPQDCGVLEIGDDDAVPESDDEIPHDYYLSSSYPNPFSHETTIQFGLPVPGHVELTIYDVVGRRVATLEDRQLPAGNHAIVWDGRNAAGQPVSSGTYFYRLNAGEFERSGKMFVLR